MVEKEKLIEQMRKVHNLKKQRKAYTLNRDSQNFYQAVEIERQTKPITDIIQKEAEKTRKETKDLTRALTQNQLPFKEAKDRISPGPVGARYLAKTADKNLKNPFYKIIGNQVYLKDSPIRFTNQEDIIIDGRTINMSENLYKLISRYKHIDYDTLTEYDKEAYYQIATHLNFFNGKRGSGGFGSNDYLIYKRIKRDREPEIVDVTGTAINLDREYLVKKIAVLKAAKAAGNTGAQKEIDQIEKEIKTKTNTTLPENKNNILREATSLYERGLIDKHKLKRLTHFLIK